MSENLYEAPSANLIDEQAEEPQFYVVSIGKFWLLYLATLTMYQLYWFYRNWSNYRAHYGEDLWPVPRALFSIFFTHSLFENIDAELKTKKSDYSWSPTLMASMFVLSAISYNITGKLAERDIGTPFTDFMFLIELPLMAWPLYSAQKAANMACGDPKGDSNRRITGANIAWIVAASAFWILILVGIYAIYMESN